MPVTPDPKLKTGKYPMSKASNAIPMTIVAWQSVPVTGIAI
jgi:hypothetical protein